MKYTYKVVDITEHAPPGVAQDFLNNLGAEGWYLVGVATTSVTGSDIVRLWFIKTEEKPSEGKK